jgi:hypothetical protein
MKRSLLLDSIEKNNKKIRESPLFIGLRRSILKKSIIFVIID